MTAVQPTKLAIPDTNPQPYESVEGSIVVACTRCKRVYRFDTGYLQSRSTATGIGPYNPQAPMRVFQVPIECGWVGCSAQLVVHVMLKSSTTAAELEKERATWICSEIEVPRGASVPLASLSRLTTVEIGNIELSSYRNFSSLASSRRDSLSRLAGRMCRFLSPLSAQG
jgi:hypothetical protein